MVMQGGLDFNHVRTFGVDLKHSSVISEPSGDLFFNFAPAGCIGHGSDSLVPLTQPPGRFFVTHPITGVENHCKIRKAGACGDCWKPGPTRHSGCAYTGTCRMCLIPWEEMPNKGKRHACGQGHLNKEPTKMPALPGEIPAEAPPSSPLALKLKAQLETNIQAAKLKRKQPEPAEPEGVAPSEAAAAEATTSNKTAKPTGDASPGGRTATSAVKAANPKGTRGSKRN